MTDAVLCQWDRGPSKTSSWASPWYLSAACFVFACSVASFLQRRKAEDGLQLYVFGMTVGTCVLVGQAQGASAEDIVLAYVSRAVCAAMLASCARLYVRSRWF